MVRYCTALCSDCPVLYCLTVLKRTLAGVKRLEGWTVPDHERERVSGEGGVGVGGLYLAVLG